jgi:hypothetical protein
LKPLVRSAAKRVPFFEATRYQRIVAIFARLALIVLIRRPIVRLSAPLA